IKPDVSRCESEPGVEFMHLANGVEETPYGARQDSGTRYGTSPKVTLEERLFSAGKSKPRLHEWRLRATTGTQGQVARKVKHDERPDDRSARFHEPLPSSLCGIRNSGSLE